ncbi:hypothetical protein CANARDRAFT_26383 [[Candida] arabinofermentans NRRL YB-2248]|uniref:PAN2-PAN3 deadenylation complex catalytic subunit PAN2 n=1 Tax=[Candida] arabinofermentans NRRL YB-2248 TaxID=983967 RepID=A0A1E4T8Z9_9ASCO|nr:hypothetical protein CANARDRAFT_26383 [[Candida] arabinofermentans NRRL YB-2248]
MEGWREVSRILAVKLPKNSPHIQPAGQPPQRMVTTVIFDDTHELIWVGDSEGYVYSYHSIKLTPYTSVRAHTGPVLKILNHKKGIVSLSSDSIRFGTKQGITKFVIKSEQLTGFGCMSYTSNTQTELFVGGSAQTLGNKILKIDLISGTISGHIDYHDDLILMDTNLKYVILGKVDGTIDILEPKHNSVVKQFRAHSASLSSICVKDNTLVTTGYSLRQDHYIPDPLVNTFDLKTLNHMTPVAFPVGATHVRMHPTAPNIIVVVSNMGQLTFIDMFNPTNLQLYQPELSSFVSLCDMSPSGECFVFIDALQKMYLWSNSKNVMEAPRFAIYSRPLPYASMDQETIPASNKLDFETYTPLNSIKLPHYDSMLLSAWPAEMKFQTGAMPRQIDPEILRSSKTIDGFTIARYNKEKYGPRNLYQKYEPLYKKKVDGTIFPKFISERDDDADENEEKVKQKHINMEKAFIYTSDSGDVPNAFKKVDILYSKFGVDDFDFDFYNNTKYAGLETHVDNSYCNAIFQLYRFVPSIFNFVVKTLAEDVKYDDSVLAELGYLYDMLVKANGKHCAASNFQRLFATIPKAKELGLLQGDSKSRDDYGQRKLIQTFNRFLLDKLVEDEKTLYNTAQPHHLNSICGVNTETSITSLFCNLDFKSNSIFHSIEINSVPQYPLLQTNLTILNHMEASMNKVTQHNIVCENCKQQHVVDAMLSIKSLPPVVTLNLDLNNEQMNEIRNYDNWLVPEFYSTTSPSGRPILRTNVIAGGSTNLNKYELIGYVAEITSRDNINHMVTMIRINDDNNNTSNSQWYLFNDFLVTKISEEEVLNLTHWWKRPVVVVYRSTEAESSFNYEDWKTTIDDSILYRDHFAKGTRDSKIIEYELLTKEEAPKPGTLVAIDAEFVRVSPDEYEFKANGTRTLVRPRKLTLARISVLRGDGPKEGKAFIDDYIATDESKVDDYITSFSGIEPGDLDPNTSKRSVVTLQTAYRKIWLLLNLGCIFVGHSLGGDFRTINIQIPPQQVRDTAEFFYLKKEKRKLGLKFLIYQLFDDRIQTGNHDSIEDAYSALKLYKKYLQLKKNGTLEKTLQRIYLEGQFSRFKVPN